MLLRSFFHPQCHYPHPFCQHMWLGWQPPPIHHFRVPVLSLSWNVNTTSQAVPAQFKRQFSFHSFSLKPTAHPSQTPVGSIVISHCLHCLPRPVPTPPPLVWVMAAEFLLFSHRSSVLCSEFLRIRDPWNFCDVISDGSTLKIIAFHHKNIIPLSILSISFQRTFLPGAGMPSALHLIALINYFLNKGELCSGPWQARASGPEDHSLHLRDIGAMFCILGSSAASLVSIH